MSAQHTPDLAVMQLWTAAAYLDWRRTRLIVAFTKNGKHLDWVTFAGHRFSSTPRAFHRWIAREKATVQPFRQPEPIAIPAERGTA